MTSFLLLNDSSATWASLTKVQSKILDKNNQNKFSHLRFLDSLNCPQVLKVKIARIKYADKMKTGYECANCAIENLSPPTAGTPLAKAFIIRHIFVRTTFKNNKIRESSSQLFKGLTRSS